MSASTYIIENTLWSKTLGKMRNRVCQLLIVLVGAKGTSDLVQFRSRFLGAPHFAGAIGYFGNFIDPWVILATLQLGNLGAIW